MCLDWTDQPTISAGATRDGRAGASPPPDDLTEIILGYADVVLVLQRHAAELRETDAHPERIRVVEDAASLWARHVRVLRDVQREEAVRAHARVYGPSARQGTPSPLSRDQEDAYR